MKITWSKILYYLRTTTITTGCHIFFLDILRCFQSIVNSNSFLIIDSGASVCITPHRSDFVSYQKSKMKIKDSSSSKTVAGEGLLWWKVEDIAGQTVTLELLGYHILGAEVCLLSPQVLLSIFGGHTTQTKQLVEVCLENGWILQAHLCPRRLPLLPFVPSDIPTSFWCDAFAYSAADVGQTKTILSSDNQNLSSFQKELLLWHQRLSHANLPWIKTLMCDRKWLHNPATASSLPSGPFIPSTSWAPTCDVWGLKCSECLCDKAATCTTKIVSKPHLPVKTNVLKRSHLVLGSCISVDHYTSSVMGGLPHTFGSEQVGYSCGTLFVDHASRKLFNFCQYSTNANETISSKHRLELLARQEGITVKEYHADNGVFASNVFKEDCDSLHQKIFVQWCWCPSSKRNCWKKY